MTANTATDAYERSEYHAHDEVALRQLVKAFPGETKREQAQHVAQNHAELGWTLRFCF